MFSTIKNINICKKKKYIYVKIFYVSTFDLSFPAYMTRSICNVEDLRDQSGYLASPGYPNNYPANLDCAARIRVNPNQSVKLFVIDMDLETNVSIECTDYLYARDETRSVTLCARRANEPIPIQWGELFIQLVSNGIENHKGFWMYYEGG